MQSEVANNLLYQLEGLQLEPAEQSDLQLCVELESTVRSMPHSA